MTANAQELLRQALTLSATDRAKIAARLLASLDEIEADVESAWAAEIERRVVDAQQNPGDEQDWRTALDEIRAEL
jgi:putative addiction module component (TIGR02574 family)